MCKNMRNSLIFAWEVAKLLILAVIIVAPIRLFIFEPFFVDGDSMEINFQDRDYLIIDKFSYITGSPGRGEVIIFKYPVNPSKKYIKRVIGLPGETVKISGGKVYINEDRLDESEYLDNTYTSGNLIMELSEKEYFVMGDNRNNSSDSRAWGSVPEDNILGKVLARILPFAHMSRFPVPAY